jgi:hypothetical protein
MEGFEPVVPWLEATVHPVGVVGLVSLNPSTVIYISPTAFEVGVVKAGQEVEPAAYEVAKEL